MKKYVVRLTDEERKCCDATVDKLAGSSQKARRARILRQVDADGPNWTGRSRQRFAAASGRSRTRAGAAYWRVSSKPWRGGSAAPRRCRNCWTGSRRRS